MSDWQDLLERANQSKTWESLTPFQIIQVAEGLEADRDRLAQQVSEWEAQFERASRANVSLCAQNQNFRQHLGAVIEKAKQVLGTSIYQQTKFPTDEARTALFLRDELRAVVKRAEEYMLGNNEAKG